jgi:hypothetical protein
VRLREVNDGRKNSVHGSCARALHSSRPARPIAFRARMKVMSVAVNMEKMMGRHFETGLANLKAASEK